MRKLIDIPDEILKPLKIMAVKKDTNCALGDCFGPSYFVTTLVHGMYNFACFVSLSSNDIFANLSHSFASGGDK